MKNYLDNLIARHMNQAEVLQPRLASRFEPQSSVFQAEVPEPESSKLDVAAADTFGADSVIAATESLVVTPEIERRVESPTVQPSRLAETVFESSGPPPTIPNPAIQHDAATPPAQPEKFQPPASIISPQIDDEPILATESTAPTKVASEQGDKSTPLATNYAIPVRSDEGSAFETPSAGVPASPTPFAPPVAAEPRPTKSTNQVALADDTAERTPRESGPARETVKRFQRAVPAKSTQTLIPAPPVELQRQVPITRTETRRETAVPIRESAPRTPSVSHLESHRSPDPPKPRQPNFPAAVDGRSRDLVPAVIIPAPETKSPVVNSAARDSQVPPNRAERFSEEVRPPHQMQRVPSLETSVVRSPRNDPMSARMVSPDDIAPVETGPTINVTIGRIEVRAATQTSEARPQKQRREQQVLSLDEYLSQRSAGGR